MQDSIRHTWMKTISEVATSTQLMLQHMESYMICMSVNATTKVAGCIAEVGVFKGGSAKLICEFKGEKKLYLFDTFEGLPELNTFDSHDEFYQGQFNDTSIEAVRKLTSPYKNVHLIKGYFPDTAGPIENEKFSLVHLDVDLHETTKNALEFFYPRMSEGGIIISHDYINANGVKKAFDDFFAEKPETVLLISDTQCMVVKV